jgi:hypothetical protein
MKGKTEKRLSHIKSLIEQLISSFSGVNFDANSREQGPCIPGVTRDPNNKAERCNPKSTIHPFFTCASTLRAVIVLGIRTGRPITSEPTFAVLYPFRSYHSGQSKKPAAKEKQALPP